MYCYGTPADRGTAGRSQIVRSSARSGRPAAAWGHRILLTAGPGPWVGGSDLGLTAGGEAVLVAETELPAGLTGLRQHGCRAAARDGALSGGSGDGALSGKGGAVKGSGGDVVEAHHHGAGKGSGGPHPVLPGGLGGVYPELQRHGVGDPVGPWPAPEVGDGPSRVCRAREGQLPFE